MTSQPDRQFLIALPEGSEARARHYLTVLRGYGDAAGPVIAAARRFPCRFSYTPDGCAWVVHYMPAGRWACGDSTRTEARIARWRCESGPTRTRVDPAAVTPGDRVTYELPGEPPFGGTVIVPRYDGVWVTEDDGGGSLGNLQRHCSFRIDWTRITGHTPAVTAQP